MKKIFNSIIAFGVMALAVSCNVENIGTLYQSEGSDVSGVSFAQSTIVDTEISAKATSFSILLNRADASKEEAIKVTADNTLVDGTNITMPATVNFAAGEYTAELKLTLNASMPVGKTFKGKISLADETQFDKNTSVSAATVTLAKAYTWVSIGEGQFYDGVALQPSASDLGIINVKIDQAEGFDRWRIYNPFPKEQLIAAWAEDYYCGGETTVIEVWANGDEGNTVSFTPNVWITGLSYVDVQADAYIYEYLPSAYSSQLAADDANNCFVMDKVIQFYLAASIENTSYWFGEGAKYLSLPGGPDLNALLSE